MDNTIEKRLATLKRNKWVKIVGYSLGIFLLSWLVVNIALGMGIVTDYQAEWNANQRERCEIERDWCRHKMANPDIYEESDFIRCAAKVKLACDFQ